MRHSFIKPRRKSLITSEIRLVLLFFSITLLMLGGTYGYLSYKSRSFAQTTQQLKKEIVDYNRSIASFEDEILFIQNVQQRSEQIFTSNTLLKDSIKNLFDLVPDRITLSRAKLEHNALILYGITPNKDVYEFMLHAPLRSIFHRTYSSFYPLENGWYRFVSTNYLDEEEL